MKKFFIFASVILILIAAGFFVGNYFVDFALKRNIENFSPPEAVKNITDENITVPPEPNFKKEIWEIISEDDFKLKADYFSPEKNSHRWAILVHGYGRDRKFAFDYAEKYLQHGYNVLIPDLRASGESEGIYITMGNFESHDIFLWAKKIVKKDAQAKIIFHGVSMGAATVLMAAALEPKNLVAVVEDCGYTSAYEMFSSQLKKIFNLPEYPVMPLADLVCKIKTGAKISDAAPINFVGKIKVPIFFIHGDADKLVPYSMMKELFDAATSKKEFWTVEGAGHAEAKIQNPEKYFNRIFSFIDKYTE